MSSFYYNLTTHDRTLNIAPATMDISTPLFLPGKDYNGYGQAYDQNFLNLLGNFANSVGPSNPITGTLWYNSNFNQLNVWNNANAAWTIVNPTLITNSTLIFTGDATGSGTVGNAVALTLKNTTVVAGTYVSANIQVDSKGRIISASNGVVGLSTTPVTSFNTRFGAVVLNFTDVVTALGFTPIGLTNTYYAVDANVVHKAGDTMSGDLNMSGTQIVTGLRAPSVATDAVRYLEYATKTIPLGLLSDTGTTNNLAVSVVSPAIPVYNAGLAVKVKVGTTITGPATININNLGAKSILWNGTNLFPNALVAGSIYEMCYDGTAFELLTTPNASGMLTNNYLANMPAKTVKGNLSGVSGQPQDIDFASLFQQILTFTPGVNGNIKFAFSGYNFIAQWMKISLASTGSGTVTWTTPFSTTCVFATCTNVNGLGDRGAQNNPVQFYSLSATTGLIALTNNAQDTAWVLAIGY